MQLQKQYDEILKKGLQLYIIFPQKRDIVAKFAKKVGLTIPALVDEDRSVIKKFDVYHRIGIDAFRIARPSVFYINKKGLLSFSYIGKNQKDRLTFNDIFKNIKENR